MYADFFSEKVYVYVDEMNSVNEFLKALKIFAKEVGVPEAIIYYSHWFHKSKNVRQFYHIIGTTLRILDRSTQWANRYGLYVGLFKEAVRKDMFDKNYPLFF